MTTHTTRLREIAKFVAGLVTADFLVGAWFLSAGAPSPFLGFTITVQEAWLWMGFDIFVLLVLIHYAWNVRLLEPRESSKALFFVIGVIMGVVTLIHFLRLVFGWSVIIDGWFAPLWVSWIGLFVAGYLCYASFHFADKHGKRV